MVRGVLELLVIGGEATCSLGWWPPIVLFFLRSCYRGEVCVLWMAFWLRGLQKSDRFLWPSGV